MQDGYKEGALVDRDRGEEKMAGRTHEYQWFTGESDSRDYFKEIAILREQVQAMRGEIEDLKAKINLWKEIADQRLELLRRAEEARP